jgi:cytidine deaminase
MNLDIQINEYNSTEQLPGKEKDLVISAINAADSAYSPYSGFSVGAAILLENGEIITGSNQENAAYPDGLCAERVALFYANSSYPDVPVTCIAISAQNDSGITEQPVTPCGSCRQALIESEFRFNKSIQIIMTGKNKILSVDSVRDLLPLSFNPSFLKGKR